MIAVWAFVLSVEKHTTGSFFKRFSIVNLQHGLKFAVIVKTIFSGLTIFSLGEFYSVYLQGMLLVR